MNDFLALLYFIIGGAVVGTYLRRSRDNGELKDEPPALILVIAVGGWIFWPILLGSKKISGERFGK